MWLFGTEEDWCAVGTVFVFNHVATNKGFLTFVPWQSSVPWLFGEFIPIFYGHWLPYLATGAPVLCLIAVRSIKHFLFSFFFCKMMMLAKLQRELTLIMTERIVSTHQSTVPLWSASSWSHHIRSICPTPVQTHLHGRSTVRTNSRLSRCRLGSLASGCSWHHLLDCSPPLNIHIVGPDDLGDTDTCRTRRSRCRCYRGGCWLRPLLHSCSHRRNPLWPQGNPWSLEVWW